MVIMIIGGGCGHDDVDGSVQGALSPTHLPVVRCSSWAATTRTATRRTPVVAGKLVLSPAPERCTLLRTLRCPAPDKYSRLRGPRTSWPAVITVWTCPQQPTRPAARTAG